MNLIQKASARVKENMLRASAQRLPDNPTAVGMKPEDIKRALWAPMLGVSNSLLGEQSRIIDEANGALRDLELRIEDEEEARRALEEAVDASKENDTLELDYRFSRHDAEEAEYRESAEEALEARAASLEQLIQGQETRLGDLHTRISANARSYVIPDLSALSDLLRGRWNANNNGGYLESSVLISGDNILIVQRDVPDFWFEQTGYGTPETYTYTDADGNKTVYPLVVYEYAGEGETPYRQLGLLHILESDYTVIEGYSKSASESAREAAAAVETVEGHLEETEERFSSLEDRMHTAEYTLRRHTRTLVFDTFESFFHFIDMGEDAFVSGVQTSTKDMKHGDVVRILEDGVPDFWYEKNSTPPRLLYNYKGKNYQMYVCSYAGMTLYGVMRPIRSCADVALGEIDAALDSIIEIQNALIGGDAE